MGVQVPGKPDGHEYTVVAYKITIWCESGEDEQGLAEALEAGELWEAATHVQYQIDPA